MIKIKNITKDSQLNITGILVSGEVITINPGKTHTISDENTLTADAFIILDLYTETATVSREEEEEKPVVEEKKSAPAKPVKTEEQAPAKKAEEPVVEKK